ncbi:hypothetical protein LOAG_13526 [Loa loa]|uniref:Uncharacterized protein n=1 Tax=Loa loa TaxID=7209 RepID=A0A1S0TKC9_LOALO|nr:hypothetical protein LOAG_13526 [Loa loa]EFO14989.1 hypothetical protein LOAG_13526 [Loa loa]
MERLDVLSFARNDPSAVLFSLFNGRIRYWLSLFLLHNNDHKNRYPIDNFHREKLPLSFKQLLIRRTDINSVNVIWGHVLGGINHSIPGVDGRTAVSGISFGIVRSSTLHFSIMTEHDCAMHKSNLVPTVMARVAETFVLVPLGIYEIIISSRSLENTCIYIKSMPYYYGSADFASRDGNQ